MKINGSLTFHNIYQTREVMTIIIINSIRLLNK